MADGEITFPGGKVWLDPSHQIVRVAFVPGTEMDLAAAEEEMKAVARVGQGKRQPLLVDLGNLKATTREAREVYGGPLSTVACTAVALLSRGAVGNMIAHVYLAVFGKGEVPTRLFTSETEAIAWLKGFRT